MIRNILSMLYIKFYSYHYIFPFVHFFQRRTGVKSADIDDFLSKVCTNKIKTKTTSVKQISKIEMIKQPAIMADKHNYGFIGNDVNQNFWYVAEEKFWVS